MLSKKFKCSAFILGILVLASLLRFAWLGRPSLWHDEIGAIELAREPGVQALFRSLVELDATRAPLHPVILQGWIGIVGHSDYAARSLSALFGIASVIVIYRLGRQLHSERVGVLAAWLLAFSPIAVHYSREIRMYSLLVFLTCVCWDLLLSFRKSASRWRQIAYGATLTALVYTHPLGGLMVIALAVGYLILGSECHLGLRAWIVIHFVVAVALGPWVVHYLNHPPELLNRLSLKLLLEWPEAFTGGGREALTVCSALVLWGIWVRRLRWDSKPATPTVRCLTASSRLTWKVGRIAPDSLLLLAWYVVPSALLLAYSLVRYPVFGPRRYLLFVAPAYFLLVASGIAALPRLMRLVTVIVATVVMVGALGPRAFDTYKERHDLKGLAALIEAHHPEALVVLLNQRPGLLHGIRYYLNPKTCSMLASELPETVMGHAATVGSPALCDEGIWLVHESVQRAESKPIQSELERLYVPQAHWSVTGFDVTYVHRRADGDHALLDHGVVRR
jgi:mannosyltransferase